MEIDELAGINDRTIEGKRQLLARLDELGIGASESDSFTISRRKAEVQEDLDLQLVIKTRLTTAGVVVRPLDAAVTTRLSTLAGLVDDAIIRDSIINADLATVTQLAAAAKGIGDILNQHTT